MVGSREVRVSCSSDAWSLGVIAYELLTGQRLYGPAPSTRAVLDAALGGAPLATEAPPPGCPLSAPGAPPLMAAGRDLVIALLQRSPTQRLQAAAAARHALFSLAA